MNTAAFAELFFRDVRAPAVRSMGALEQFRFLHSERAVSELRRHYARILSNGNPMDECNFYQQVHEFSTLPDFQIMQIFDFFDVSLRRTLGFPAFFTAVALVVAVEARCLLLFLFQHERTLRAVLTDTFVGKITVRRIRELTTAAGASHMELSAALRGMDALARAQLKPKTATLVLFDVFRRADARARTCAPDAVVAALAP
eukprot:gnl/Chilomastix_cuspidata/378.p1 GENE.gnl/Chilomastix_cuspidata/378~~gnl/Chilomastix_cuspidata/378.p1  ORF type:complete len:201 (-),score=113.38 gnl/Chilomastix_cuspidata/378:182-784(-)